MTGPIPSLPHTSPSADGPSPGPATQDFLPAADGDRSFYSALGRVLVPAVERAMEERARIQEILDRIAIRADEIGGMYRDMQCAVEEYRCGQCVDGCPACGGTGYVLQAGAP